MRSDGRLDDVKLLAAFQAFFRENAEHWLQRFAYQEAGPQLLMQAFLQRIVNGGGYVERDPDPTLPTHPGPYPPMYFSVRARVYDPNDPPAPELGWQDPVRGNYAPDVNAFPYTTPITLDIDVPTVLPTGRTILEIEVADNAERTNARIIRVQIPFYWRVGP